MPEKKARRSTIIPAGYLGTCIRRACPGEVDEHYVCQNQDCQLEQAPFDVMFSDKSVTLKWSEFDKGESNRPGLHLNYLKVKSDGHIVEVRIPNTVWELLPDGHNEKLRAIELALKAWATDLHSSQATWQFLSRVIDGALQLESYETPPTSSHRLTTGPERR